MKTDSSPNPDDHEGRSFEKGTLRHRASRSRKESNLQHALTRTHHPHLVEPHLQLNDFCLSVFIHLYIHVCIISERTQKVQFSPLSSPGRKRGQVPSCLQTVPLTLAGWRWWLAKASRHSNGKCLVLRRSAPGALTLGAHPSSSDNPSPHSPKARGPMTLRSHLFHRPSLRSTVFREAKKGAGRFSSPAHREGRCV